MRQIILASNSPQRKALLKQLGLKFKVVKVQVKEKMSASRSYSRLVKENALVKARSAAKNFDKGVVISADTIVVCDRKIIGKPKNMADARKTLKFLSGKPQWVYTGIAVIDVENKKTLTDFEKTKIYMSRLSDEEIKKYLLSAKTLDKAGSFDIQGKGAMLIDRIEGCFYNVVGLPLAKLYKMLRKVGVSILFILLAVNIFGCSTEYNLGTDKEDIIFYGTDKEVAMGDSMSKEFEIKYKPVEDVTVQKRIQDIGAKIAEVCDRKDIIYHFKVVEDKEVNALSLPGGYVYVFKGLVDKVKTDDELASVIAHEVGHIVAKHSIKKLQAAMGYNLLNILAATTTNADFAQGVDLAFYQIFMGYSKEDELQADKLGVKYMRKAGYNPQGMIDFFEKLKEVSKKEPAHPFSYWMTHPYIAERIGPIRQEAFGQMNFIDYYNKHDKDTAY